MPHLTRRLPRTWALLLLPALGLALDVPPPPDPIGLGERLAAIDYLKEHGVTPPTSATDAQLLKLYRETWLRQPANAAVLEQEQAAAAAAERIQRLRAKLATVSKDPVPPGLSENELIALLQRIRAADDARKASDIEAMVKADRERQAAAPPPAPEAPPTAAVAAPEAQPGGDDAAVQPVVTKVPTSAPMPGGLPGAKDTSKATATGKDAGTVPPSKSVAADPDAEAKKLGYNYVGFKGPCSVYWIDAPGSTALDRTVYIYATNTDSVPRTVVGHGLSSDGRRESTVTYSLTVLPGKISSSTTLRVGFGIPHITVDEVR